MRTLRRIVQGAIMLYNKVITQFFAGGHVLGWYSTHLGRNQWLLAGKPSANPLMHICLFDGYTSNAIEFYFLFVVVILMFMLIWFVLLFCASGAFDVILRFLPTRIRLCLFLYLCFQNKIWLNLKTKMNIQHDNNNNDRHNFGHNNHDVKISYRYIPSCYD